MITMSQRVSIAIIGGGLAGCTLANGILSLPNLTFDIFESKAEFGERGAGVGLGINAQHALREMGLDPDVRITNAGGVRMKSTYCLIVSDDADFEASSLTLFHRDKAITEVARFWSCQAAL